MNYLERCLLKIFFRRREKRKVSAAGKSPEGRTPDLHKSVPICLPRAMMAFIGARRTWMCSGN